MDLYVFLLEANVVLLGKWKTGPIPCTLQEGLLTNTF